MGTYVAQKWQPIETAPKDGRWFLVSAQGYNLPRHARFIGESLNIYTLPNMHGEDPPKIDATHWMPFEPHPVDE